MDNFHARDEGGLASRGWPRFNLLSSVLEEMARITARGALQVHTLMFDALLRLSYGRFNLTDARVLLLDGPSFWQEYHLGFNRPPAPPSSL